MANPLPTPPFVQPGNIAPLGICNIDPTSGLVYSAGCANYTPIDTAGTTTIDASTGGGVLYGFNAISTGTSWTVTAYDVYTIKTSTYTNALIATQTAASTGFQGNPGSGGTGVRYNGNLLVVTTGTPGLWNILWD
jgi:hypothetical protein